MASAHIPVGSDAKSSTAKWITGLLIFLIVCLGAWQLSLHAFGANPTASQPVQLVQPQPVEHTQSTGNVAFPVRAQGAYNYKVMVPAGALNVTLKGHFAATGGRDNDIEVFVVNQDEFVNWENHHPVNAMYTSGKVTQDSININLPSDAGNYYVVFNNKFSLLTPKAVEAKFDLNFYTR